MEIETITKLLDAGYTKAEIDAMQSGDGPSGEGNEGAEEETPPKGEESGTAGAGNKGEIAPDIKALIETVNGLTATVKAMQEKNASGAATASPKTSDKIKEVMDSFIESL